MHGRSIRPPRSPERPPYVATFDSATAMAMATARVLHGRDFPDLGHPRWLHWPVAASDLLPRRLRSHLFAVAGAREGVRADDIDAVSGARIAEWLAGLYPERRFPMILLGSSNGALVHLCAAVGAPWLPQTVLVPVRRDRPGDPEDGCAALALGAPLGARLLARHPEWQLHQLHDPNQDRLMLRHMLYFRLKWRRLPEAYRRFLERSLAPGGALVLVDCRRSWPTTRLGPRHVFQHGAVGGATEEEYRRGSPRVAAHLRRMGSARERWIGPAADGVSPEAEWGFEAAVVDELADWARRRGARLLRLSFARPEDPSAAVAELYRRLYRGAGLPDGRLHVESFIQLEPYWTLRLGLIPYWMVFNMEPSAARLERFLDDRPPFDDILLTLFAHGVDSVGLPPIRRWREILRRARRRGAFLGVDAGAYPAHFSVFARYQQALRALDGPVAAPPPLQPDEALEALAADPLLRLERIC